jgi:hypothetical protein
MADSFNESNENERFFCLENSHFDDVQIHVVNALSEKRARERLEAFLRFLVEGKLDGK